MAGAAIAASRRRAFDPAVTRLPHDERLLVGTNGSDYARQRNILSLPLERYRTVQAYDVFRLARFLLYRGLGRSDQLIENLFCDFGLNRCHLLHFFNAVSLGRTPWVTTFETSLPRWRVSTERFVERGLRCLASPTCGRLIAMSQCAYDIQRDRLDAVPALREAIVGKLTVVHPPQEIFVDDVERKDSNDRITFTLVGEDFFRKGGAEVLRVFARLIDEGQRVRLNIVSSMVYGDYATQTSRHDLETAMQLIHKHPDAIHHYPQLPNDAVLRLLRASHVGLLPTYADTYGYSVLEAQANGCPVITTNVRALPETNDDECGWMINLPTDAHGNARLESNQARACVSRLLQEQLEAVVRTILRDPAMIKHKARRALERLKQRHDPRTQAAKIEAIYDSVLATRGAHA